MDGKVYAGWNKVNGYWAEPEYGDWCHIESIAIDIYGVLYAPI